MSLSDLDQTVLLGISAMLKALSDPNRLKIMRALQAGPKSVSELVAIVQTSQPNVSKHLKMLSEIYLVTSKRDRNHIIYSVAHPVVDQLCEAVCGSYAALVRAKTQEIEKQKKVG